MRSLNLFGVIICLTLIFLGSASAVWGINLGQVLEKAAQDYVNKNKPPQNNPAPATPPAAIVQPQPEDEEEVTNQGPAAINVLGKKVYNKNYRGHKTHWQAEVHAIQIYQATRKMNLRRKWVGQNEVRVAITGNRPAYLFLSSREAAHWVVYGNTHLLKGIHIHGYNRSSISGVNPNIVEHDSFLPYEDFIPERAPASSEEPGDALIRFSQESGLPIGSTQGQWEGNSFTIYTGN